MKKAKKVEQVAPSPAPCTTCGPGKIRASYFPSTLRMWETREDHAPDFELDAVTALAGASKSPLWIMLEDLVERRRDELLMASLEAVSSEAASANAFRAQGAEVILRSLRTIRAAQEQEVANAPANV